MSTLWNVNALHLLLALTLSPLLLGIVNRVKAKFAGRQGKPLLQLYSDLAKLLRKGEVISTSTCGVFSAGPSVTLATIICALALLPFANHDAILSFQGDFILVAYLLGMGRFALMLAALDTASPFEGMGASREATFSALAEPVIFLCFLSLAGSGASQSTAGTLSLSSMFGGAPLWAWEMGRPELLLIPLVLFVLLLVENCRIPADDPNTHLELTMIHEVIILDHSGPNLAFILYGAALKLWFFAALLAGILLPVLSAPLWLQIILSVGIIFTVTILVGIVESIMARVRMTRIPALLGGAGALAALTLILSLMRQA
ncbi:MAG: NADH-quinone oxidoreductase subunit H [Desulfovibrionaceae bacterium]